MTRAQSPTHNLPSWKIQLSIDLSPPLDPYRQDYRGRFLKMADGNDGNDDDSTPQTASTWLPQGPTEQGFLLLPDQPKHHVRAKYPPSIATHRGQLWTLWTDFDDVTYYAATTPESHGDAFGARTIFPAADAVAAATNHGSSARIPVLANLNGVLHAILVSVSTGQMTHWIYDADEQDTWLLQQDGPPPSCVPGEHTRDPALAAFHNKLFLAYIAADGSLWHAIFDVFTQTWTGPAPVVPSPSALVDGEEAAISTFRGAPALFVLNGALHLLAESSTAKSAAAEILAYRYDRTETAWQWSPTDDVTEGKAVRGISAASYGGSAYLAFLSHDGAAYVSSQQTTNTTTSSGNSWQDAERVGGKNVKARFAPRIAVLNGRVHTLFAGKWVGDVHWFSRPVLAYDLGRWMGAVEDAEWVSALTVPGTHDSCARSEVPFVRTQYLSISQQLALGIRFFDLRLRRHDDGKLYCYHGGMPIGLPRGLSFAQVMEEVWAFIEPKGENKATETVLVSINNDDKSKDQKQHPQAFYHAVKEAIESTPPYEDGSSRWYTEPVTPKLGEVRGKAMLLRRFYGDPDVEATERIGLDLEKWKEDNPDFSIVTPNGVKVRLQDKWKYTERCELKELIASKQDYVQKMMQRAAGLELDEDANSHDSDPAETWYINFCSAVGDPVEHGEVAQAKWIAVGAHSDYHFFGGWVEGMNVRTRDYLRGLGAGRKRLGVVNLDYPELPEDSDLVARLIETNF